VLATLESLIQNQTDPSFELVFNSLWMSSDSLRLDTQKLKPLWNWEQSPPLADTHSISISHSKLGGALASIQKPFQVGVDVEDTDRLHRKLLERVSTTSELDLCPEPKWIWTAKEAAFKAYYPHNKSCHVGDISVDKWKSVDKQTHQFTSCIKNQDVNGTGWLIYKDNLNIAVVLLTPVSS